MICWLRRLLWAAAVFEVVCAFPAARGVTQERGAGSKPTGAGSHRQAEALAAQADIHGETAEHRLALRSRPNAAYKELAALLQKKGDVDGAIEECRLALQLKRNGAEAHACIARALSAKGDTDGAIAEYREALSEDPASPDLHNCLGIALKAKGNLDAAAAEFREAALLNPGHAEAHYNLGSALHLKGDLDGAIAEYRRVLSLRPDWAGVHSRLGLALQTRGDSEGCLAEYWQAAILMPDSAEAHKDLAFVLRAKGDWEGALQHFRTAVRLEPDYALAHYDLGLILREQGELPDAIAEYREAVRAEPDFYEAYNNLGNALQKTGDLDHAVAAYQEAIRLRPDFPQAHGNLGEALAEKGRLQDAVAEYRRAARLNPNDPQFHFALGLALAEKGEHEIAIGEYRSALRLRPDFSKARQALGRSLEAKGDLDGAIAAYREAVRLSREQRSAYSDLGLALRTQGDLRAAAEAFRDELEIDNNNPLAHNNLGVVLDEDDQVGEAIAEYREALRLKRDLLEAHNNLGNALSFRGDLDDAVSEYRVVVSAEQDFADARCNLALALKAKGDVEGAIAEYRQAIRVKPDFAIAHANLGAGLEMQDDLDGAIVGYHEALRLKPDNALAHDNLAVALAFSGDLHDAIAQYREAIRLNPKLALPNGNEDSPRTDYTRINAVTPECRGAMFPLEKVVIGAEASSDKVVVVMNRECREALQLEPEDSGAYFSFGNPLDKIGSPTLQLAQSPVAPGWKRLNAETNPNSPSGKAKLAGLGITRSQLALGKASAPRQSEGAENQTWRVAGHVVTLKGEPVGRASVKVTTLGPGLVRTAETNLKGDFEIQFALRWVSRKDPVAEIAVTKDGYFDARERAEVVSPGKIKSADLVLRQCPEDVHQLSLAALISYLSLRPQMRRLIAGSGTSIDSDADLQRAQGLLEREDTEEAVLLLERLTQRASACVRCRTMLGLALLQRGSWSSAVREFDDAAFPSASATSKTRSPEPFLVLGVLETWRQHLRRAAFFLLQALEVDSSDPLALQELGRVLLLSEKTKAADQYLRAAIKAGAGSEAHLLRARVLLDEGSAEEAEAEMTAYLGGRKAKELPSDVRMDWMQMKARVQIESKGNAVSVVDIPIPNLVRNVPDLKGLQPATSQNEQVLLLRKVGEEVKAFFAGFPNTTSVEEIVQQRLSPNGKVRDSVRRKYKYLLLTRSEALGLGLDEYRTDSRGAASGLAGALITEGFASQALHFHPLFQSGSRFRYLGRQSVNGFDTCVLAFAQRPEKARAIEDFRIGGGNTAPVLVQGLAWVDSTSYRIIRMRTELLKPEPDVKLDRQTTDIYFGDVHFSSPKSSFWLPREVAVTVEWNGKIFRNLHRYSEYNLFNVEAKEKLKAPRISPEAASSPE